MHLKHAHSLRTHRLIPLSGFETRCYGLRRTSLLFTLRRPNRDDVTKHSVVSIRESSSSIAAVVNRASTLHASPSGFNPPVSAETIVRATPRRCGLTLTGLI